MNVHAALTGQYHAALEMLGRAIERCPDSLWTDGQHPCQFWQIAYHTLFYTHLYLQPDEQSFRPWEHHRDQYQFLSRLPWPPHDPPVLGEPYDKMQIHQYAAVCDAMVDTAVARLDLSLPTSGFGWYDIPKLDHQMVNIRHIQHHAAQLADRLRLAAGMGVEWIGARG